MEIFVSWSGDLSKKVAALISNWIPNVLQSVKPWFSDEDVEKGVPWLNKLSDKLNKIKFGICCLTKENINAPWVLFECGMIAKNLDKSRVFTFLIDISQKDLMKNPLDMFQSTSSQKQDIYKLIHSINNLLEIKLERRQLETTFEKWWSDFEVTFEQILENIDHAPQPEKPSQEDAIYEMLDISRSIYSHTRRINEKYFVTARPNVDGALMLSIPNYPQRTLIIEKDGTKHLPWSKAVDASSAHILWLDEDEV